MSNLLKKKQLKRAARIKRVRAKISGTADRPRLVVFRSLKHISAQLIDDAARQTLASVMDTELTNIKGKKKMAQAELVGKLLAEKAAKAGITAVVFDRRAYKYHGRIKSLADGARSGGLRF